MVFIYICLVWIFTLKTIASFKPEQVIYKKQHMPTESWQNTLCFIVRES